MKKTTIWLICTIFIISCFSTAFASEELSYTKNSTDIYAITTSSDVASQKPMETLKDDADLFSDEQEMALKNKISTIDSLYNFDITLVTVPTLNGGSLLRFADDYEDLDDFSDGAVFVVNMEPSNRGYFTSTRNLGIEIFSDDALFQIDNKVQPLLADGKYYEAFDKFLDLSDDFLQSYHVDGNIYKGPLFSSEQILVSSLIGLVIGAAISFAGSKSMIKAMNTAVKRSEASNYLKSGSLVIDASYDRFLYENTTRVAIPKNNNSGGSGRVRTNSRGGSRGGRGGSF